MPVTYAKPRACRSRTWESFAKELSREIRRMRRQAGAYLVVQRLNPTRYVQFAFLAGQGILCEAVSNHFLPRSERLAAPTMRELERLGWQKPRLSPPRKNFWLECTSPASLDRIVTLAVKTLRDVFRIPSPAELSIRGGEFAAAGHTATTLSLTSHAALPGWIPPVRNPALLLESGLIVRSGLSGREFRVGPGLGAGAFGAAYQVEHVKGGQQLPGKLALKVTAEPRGWYREAYFGDLLDRK